jgi:hypothetical protein
VRPSDEAITKMLAGLAKVIASPTEPAAVKIQALRSYGRLARGTSHAEEAEQVLLAAAKNANDDRTTLGIADALHALGSPKGVELMWKVFGKIPAEGENVEARQLAYRVLDNAESVPPTVESVRMVAEFVATNAGYGGGMMGAGMGGMPGGMGMMMSGPGRSTSLGPLNRLTASADGIRRLVEATVSMPQEIGGAMPDDGGSVSPQLTGLVGGAMMTDITPRNILLTVLKDTAPANEEIASALVEALASKDAGVRAAAAEALGNVSELNVDAQSDLSIKTSTRVLGPTSEAKKSSSSASGGAILELPESVRADLSRSLMETVRNKATTTRSRIEALELLARTAAGTDQAKDAASLALSINEDAKADQRERATAIGVARAVLPPEERTEALWSPLSKEEIDERLKRWQEMEKSRAIPTDAQSTAELTSFALLTMVANARAQAALNVLHEDMEEFEPTLSHSSVNVILARMLQTGDGVRKMLAAIPLTGEFDESLEIPMDYGTSRGFLLSQIARITPVSDDVAVALGEALSSDDEEIRKAAATALSRFELSKARPRDTNDDPKVVLGKRVFFLLDRDKDGMASVEELSKLQRMRPAFENAGIDLQQPMTENQFIEAYRKADP